MVTTPCIIVALGGVHPDYHLEGLPKEAVKAILDVLAADFGNDVAQEILDNWED